MSAIVFLLAVPAVWYLIKVRPVEPLRVNKRTMTALWVEIDEELSQHPDRSAGTNGTTSND